MCLEIYARKDLVLYWIQTKLFLTLPVQSKRKHFHLNSKWKMTLCCFEKGWQLRSPECIVIDSMALCMARRHVHCVDYSQAERIRQLRAFYHFIWKWWSKSWAPAITSFLKGQHSVTPSFQTSSSVIHNQRPWIQHIRHWVLMTATEAVFLILQ